MLVKELTSKFSIAENNPRYNSDEWYLYVRSRLDQLLNVRYGRRELFDYISISTDPQTEAAVYIDSMLEYNAYKYRHLWKLYTADYNPLWNVEGTETTERIRKNTGTQEDKLSGKDTLTKSGTEKMEKSGHDDITKTGTEKVDYGGHDDLTMSGQEADAKTGSDTLAYSGTEKNEKGGAVTTAKTTFDSASFLDTEKQSDTTSDTKTFTNRQDQTTYLSTNTKSFTNRKDEQSYASNDTLSFTNRKDETAYNSSDTLSFTGRKDETDFGKTNTRTDDLTEHETTVNTRGGNIGVTTSAQLQTGEIEWLQKFNFLDQIARDIANEISYIYY